MPSVGQVENRYGRLYVWVQPDPAKGPGTWRVANSDTIVGEIVYDFHSTAPVDVETTIGDATNPTAVTTSMDFVQLDDRTA